MPGPKFASTKKSSLKYGFAGKGTGKSHAEANVAGYEKRLARKAKTGPELTDLYEHVQQNKWRRAKVGMDLDRDEAKEFGVGLDGGEEEDREHLRARLIGELEDDEDIASDDDEEIDSDAAFEESDEDRFAGFFSAKKSKSKSTNKKSGKSTIRFADVNLDEDEDMESDGDNSEEDDSSEAEEEGEDDEFIDLLDVLDGKGDIDMGSDVETTSKSASGSNSRDAVPGNYQEMGQVSEDSEDPEDDDEDVGEETENEQAIFEPSDDEEAPEALDQLNDFVSNLDSAVKKRKAPEEDSDTAAIAEARARKRRFTKERTEAGDENEFRAHSSGSKLNLGDLLAPLSTPSSTLQSLRKSTKVLEPSGSAKAKTLSAPLPQRTQERLDRQAAYEQTKEEVDKWTDTMKRIRDAEHLSFPLQAQSSGRVSNLELNAKFKPTTELESSVDALLKSAKMREEDIHQTEDRMLEMNKLTVEEVAQRRGELRKMRELMFRAEIKAKRIGKIKSKTYRRLRRKEKERLGEQIDENNSDPGAGILKQELDRARERATLRHKHTGKWARQMRNKEGMDGDNRRDIEEMLARGEKLRRRIKGVESDESEDGEEEEDDDDKGLDLEANIEKIKQGAFDELRRLDDDDSEQAGSETQKGKGVFEMKFMKDAMARRKLEVGQEKDDFIKEMGGHVSGGDDSDEEQDVTELDLSGGVVAHKAGGRIVYRPGAPSSSSLRPLNSLASDTSSVTLRSTDFISPPLSPAQTRPSGLSSSIAPDHQSNPWLTHDSKGKSKATKKINEVVVGKDSKPADKSKNRLKKANQKKEELQEQAKDDAVVEISLDTVLESTPAATVIQSIDTNAIQKAKSRPQKSVVLPAPSVNEPDSDDSGDDNIELEVQEQALQSKAKGKGNGLKAFEQRDLVALAFAGDNVVQSFEDAKRREIVSDAPREVDTTIPGWGSWGGAGVHKAPPKPSRIKKIAGIDPTTRADYNKKNIIISEKRDKKAGKYLVKDLPYPYTSKAQFERAMERPLGVEWNTRVAFQRGTLPKVVKKPGVIIDPLEKHAA